MIVFKDGVEKIIRDSQLGQYLNAGWSQQSVQVKAEEEIIRLKPAVKNKATANPALDEASITNKGDE